MAASRKKNRDMRKTKAQEIMEEERLVTSTDEDEEEEKTLPSYDRRKTFNEDGTLKEEYAVLKTGVAPSATSAPSHTIAGDGGREEARRKPDSKKIVKFKLAMGRGIGGIAILIFIAALSMASARTESMVNGLNPAEAHRKLAEVYMKDGDGQAAVTQVQKDINDLRNNFTVVWPRSGQSVEDDYGKKAKSHEDKINTLTSAYAEDEKNIIGDKEQDKTKFFETVKRWGMERKNKKVVEAAAKKNPGNIQTENYMQALNELASQAHTMLDIYADNAEVKAKLDEVIRLADAANEKYDAKEISHSAKDKNTTIEANYGAQQFERDAKQAFDDAVASIKDIKQEAPSLGWTGQDVLDHADNILKGSYARQYSFELGEDGLPLAPEERYDEKTGTLQVRFQVERIQTGDRAIFVLTFKNAEGQTRQELENRLGTNAVVRSANDLSLKDKDGAALEIEIKNPQYHGDSDKTVIDYVVYDKDGVIVDQDHLVIEGNHASVDAALAKVKQELASRGYGAQQEPEA